LSAWNRSRGQEAPKLFKARSNQIQKTWTWDDLGELVAILAILAILHHSAIGRLTHPGCMMYIDVWQYMAIGRVLCEIRAKGCQLGSLGCHKNALTKRWKSLCKE